MFCCFGPVFGRGWPQDPLKRVRLEKWCRTHLELARRPIINHFVANSWSKPKTKMQNGCLTDSKLTGHSRTGCRYKWPVDPARTGTPKRSAHAQPGYIKAVWPHFLAAFLRSGRPRGPGKALQNMGGFAPHMFEDFPGPPGPARPQKRSPTNSARLPSGTQSPAQGN